jgi:hypothetical protein
MNAVEDATLRSRELGHIALTESDDD